MGDVTEEAREDATLRHALEYLRGRVDDVMVAQAFEALRVVLKERDTLLLVRDSLDSDVATLHSRLLRAEEALREIAKKATGRTSRAMRTTCTRKPLTTSLPVPLSHRTARSAVLHSHRKDNLRGRNLNHE